jgi:hypothetical protein
MKKWLSTYLFLFMCCFGYTQESLSRYIDFDRTWHGIGYSAFSPPSEFSLHFLRDSVLIDNKYYFKRVGNGFEPPLSPYITYWRQEGEKVYRLDGDDELLIYDFGLDKGDTLQYVIEINGTSLSIVDSVRAESFSHTGPRKVWYISSYCNAEKVEEYRVFEGLGTDKIHNEYRGNQCVIREDGSQVFCIYQGNMLEWFLHIECPGLATHQMNNYNKQWIVQQRNDINSPWTYHRYTHRKLPPEPNIEHNVLVTTDPQSTNSFTETGISCGEFGGIVSASSGNNRYQLFNYNLAVGDTFELKHPIYPNTYIVRKTGKRLLNDLRYYRTLSLSLIGDSTIVTNWVEGIGDIDTYLFYYEPNAKDKYNLTCHYFNFMLIYNDADSQVCDLKSNTDDWTDASDLSIYPNPCVDQLNIEVNPSNIIKSVEIFNISGQCLLSNDIGSERATIDIYTWDAGFYLGLARMEDGRKTSFKFIKS